MWCKKKKRQHILLCISSALGNSGFKRFLCRSGTNKVCLFGFNLVRECVCDFPFLYDQWSLQHSICFTFQILQARVVWDRRWLSPASPWRPEQPQTTVIARLHPYAHSSSFTGNKKHMRPPQGSLSAPARRTWDGRCGHPNHNSTLSKCLWATVLMREEK